MANPQQVYDALSERIELPLRDLSEFSNVTGAVAQHIYPTVIIHGMRLSSPIPSQIVMNFTKGHLTSFRFEHVPEEVEDELIIILNSFLTG